MFTFNKVNSLRLLISQTEPAFNNNYHYFHFRVKIKQFLCKLYIYYILSLKKKPLEVMKGRRLSNKKKKNETIVIKLFKRHNINYFVYPHHKKKLCLKVFDTLVLYYEHYTLHLYLNAFLYKKKKMLTRYFKCSKF